MSRASLRRLTAGAPAYREAFAESPFHSVCSVWRAGRAGREARAPVASGVPTLILVGRFDPYGPKQLAEQAARKLSRSWVVEVPNWSYNVMHEPCANAVRNAWVDAPTSSPDTSCIKRLRPLKFALR